VFDLYILSFNTYIQMVHNNKSTIEETVRAVNGNRKLKFVVWKISFLCAEPPIRSLSQHPPPTHTHTHFCCGFVSFLIQSSYCEICASDYFIICFVAVENIM